jgi:hypothetical protein
MGVRNGGRISGGCSAIVLRSNQGDLSLDQTQRHEMSTQREAWQVRSPIASAYPAPGHRCGQVSPERAWNAEIAQREHRVVNLEVRGLAAIGAVPALRDSFARMGNDGRGFESRRGLGLVAQR